MIMAEFDSFKLKKMDAFVEYSILQTSCAIDKLSTEYLIHLW
jgi:hypothetical protein